MRTRECDAGRNRWLLRPARPYKRHELEMKKEKTFFGSTSFNHAGAVKAYVKTLDNYYKIREGPLQSK